MVVLMRSKITSKQCDILCESFVQNHGGKRKFLVLRVYLNVFKLSKTELKYKINSPWRIQLIVYWRRCHLLFDHSYCFMTRPTLEGQIQSIKCNPQVTYPPLSTVEQNL